MPATVVKQEFDKKDMIFRRLGPSGLRIPVFSLGGWLTLGGTVKGDPVKEIIKTAFDAGINMFDTAEAYAAGQSEIEMGRVVKELGYRRSDLIITTKIFWGVRQGPNAQGLSRKHIVEGATESLERLGMDYVDVIFAHRCDITVPMEEIVRAFNHVIEKGQAFYWGTSEWTSQQIEEAFHVAHRLNLIAPIAEQCQHNLFHRDRPELEYAPLYRNYGFKTTVFSALAGGLLTGKYNDGVPEGSRLDMHRNQAQFARTIKEYESETGREKIAKVKKLTEFAEKELGTTVTALSLAWVAVNPNTSTVILGASRPEQLKENLKALEVLPKLTPEVLRKIEEIVGTVPKPEVGSWSSCGYDAMTDRVAGIG
ncbi:NADP-dependent oxidoreductase domain-containing protein [Gautieria morchelliformis]|nr:NADP-dependent oxidoreductase domain-containing protein [Gautieria morchelliformis]